ncbi:hypothetical protein GGP51_003008 [Salinibacter ruber]|nr:hypothetical protein [Salinibacter ruber]
MRHPLRRIQSNWLDIIWALDNDLMQVTDLHRSGALNISGDFNGDVQANDGLVETSNYWRVVQEYRRYFSDEQIQIVFLEDLKSTPDPVLAACCTFLDVDPEFDFTNLDEARNASADKGIATSLGSVVRSIPGYSTLVDWMPDFLRTSFRPLIKDTFTEKPDWKPTVRQEVVSNLESDTKAFHKYVDKPHDYWSL